MSSWGGPAGFSLLLWVNVCPDEETGEKDLLEDAVTLLSVRWGLEFTIEERNDRLYAWCYTSRFSIGEGTVQRALGDLCGHGWVGVLKCSPSTTIEQAIRFQQCKEKWSVPDAVSTSSGDDSGTREPLWKRPKKQ